MGSVIRGTYAPKQLPSLSHCAWLRLTDGAACDRLESGRYSSAKRNSGKVLRKLYFKRFYRIIKSPRCKCQGHGFHSLWPRSPQKPGSIPGCEIRGDIKGADALSLCQGMSSYWIFIMTGCRWAEGKVKSRAFLWEERNLPPLFPFKKMNSWAPRGQIQLFFWNTSFMWRTSWEEKQDLWSYYRGFNLRSGSPIADIIIEAAFILRASQMVLPAFYIWPDEDE